MLRALGFKSGITPLTSDSTHSESFTSHVQVLEDAISLENGLRAMDLVMDDRPDEAQRILKDGQATYYKLSRGVIHFIEATLGFEPEAIKRAVDSLYEAEQSSSHDRSKCQRSNLPTSSYPPGSEYALTLAEANLMGAIALFLSESMIDAAKAFLRLRKAYQILADLNNQIEKHHNLNTTTTTNSSNILSTALSHLSGKHEATTTASDNPFDGNGGMFSPEQTSKLRELAKIFQNTRNQRLSKVSNNSSSTLINDNDDSASSLSPSVAAVDEFITSGVYCMFGLLQLILSIIPPTLGKVMSLVGFKGDREAGLKMLWKAADSTNIHGAIALLALLQFYDGPTQFADIQMESSKHAPTSAENNNAPSSLSSSQIQITGGGSGNVSVLSEIDSSYSSISSSSSSSSSNGLTEQDLAKIKKRLCIALDRARNHYSRGALWQLQKGRMVAQTDLVGAVEILDDTSNGPIQMTQVEGLMLFDKTLMTLVLHQYEKSAECFIRLIDLNTWSHAFYMYLAGSCYIELYRENKVKKDGEQAAATYKKKAKECIEKAPTMLGKRKFMAKAMPFDVFVLRKINHWKSVASSNNIDIIDAVGTSPIHEVLYFYNGFSKMPKENLEATLKSLGYSGQQGTPFAGKLSPPLRETDDQSVSRYLLQSITLRCLGRKQEGYELLKSHVMDNVCTPNAAKGFSANGIPNKLHYHRHLAEPWSGPSALYERGIFQWQIYGPSHAGATREYLDLAANWDEDYELSTRVAFKIKSAKDRLDSYNL